jgi:hypothetical protein
LLLRPRDGAAGIGGDPSGRFIDAALLYARIAELEERRGNPAAAERAFAEGVELLRAAHHPDPTEAQLRRSLAALASRQKPPQ